MRSPPRDGRENSFFIPNKTYCLTLLGGLVDTQPVLEKERTGFDSSTCTRRTNGAMPFFYVCACLRSSSMSGDGGGAARLAGYLVRRSVNPAICRSPRLTAGRGCTVQGQHHD